MAEVDKCRDCAFYAQKADINGHGLNLGYCDCPTKYYPIRKIKMGYARVCSKFERRKRHVDIRNTGRA